MEDPYVWTADDEQVSHLLLNKQTPETDKLACQMALHHPSNYLHRIMSLHLRNHYLDLVT